MYVGSLHRERYLVMGFRVAGCHELVRASCLSELVEHAVRTHPNWNFFVNITTHHNVVKQ